MKAKKDDGHGERVQRESTKGFGGYAPNCWGFLPRKVLEIAYGSGWVLVHFGFKNVLMVSCVFRSKFSFK